MKICFLTITLAFLQFSAFGQSNIEQKVKEFSCSCQDQNAVREYFEQFENQQKFIARCEHDNEEKRKLLNIKSVKVSGFGPSAVSLVKPFYPQTARELKIYGEVIVEVFTDEKGAVIYSKILKGNAFLQASVRKSACRSKFTPILYCGKPIKARWIIRYTFVRN